MLTRELALREFDGHRIKPDQLSKSQHKHYEGYAERVLRVYAEGIGKMRSELHHAVRRIFKEEPDCPPQRIDAFCKLLEESSIATFDTDRRARAAALRCKVFNMAAQYHPLVEHKDQLFEHEEQGIKQRFAEELAYPDWAAVESAMFADVFEYNRLLKFKGYPSPKALLSRYNVAQVQVALFDATRLVIEVRADFKRVVTHLKLARLLHEITSLV